MQTQDNTVMCY